MSYIRKRSRFASLYIRYPFKGSMNCIVWRLSFARKGCKQNLKKTWLVLSEKMVEKGLTYVITRNGVQWLGSMCNRGSFSRSRAWGCKLKLATTWVWPRNFRINTIHILFFAYFIPCRITFIFSLNSFCESNVMLVSVVVEIFYHRK